MPGVAGPGTLQQDHVQARLGLTVTDMIRVTVIRVTAGLRTEAANPA